MLVIHIGPRKTGTTFLQNNFHRNRRALLKAGWLYPQVALRVQSAHHEIVSARAQFLAGQGIMVDRLARANRKAERHGANVFLSSEGFHKWKADDLRRLGDMMGREKVLIVYSLRDPVSRLASLWGESVKNGRRASLPDFVGKALAGPQASAHLNALLELQPIIEHHGLDLLVLDSEVIHREGGDLYTVFCREALGLPDMAPVRTRPANSSLGVELNEYLRLLSRKMDYDPSDKPMMLARHFLRSHSAREIAEIESMIRLRGTEARGSITIDRSENWFQDLDRSHAMALAPYLRPTSNTGPLFSREKTALAHYDIDRLGEIAEIATWLETSSHRLTHHKPLWRRSRAQEIWRRIKRLFVV